MAFQTDRLSTEALVFSQTNIFSQAILFSVMYQQTKQILFYLFSIISIYIKCLNENIAKPNIDFILLRHVVTLSYETGRKENM